MFSAIANQMAFLFSLVILGYILSKSRVVPENSETVLSKLENYLFIPALVLGTFINNFTVEKLGKTGKLLLGSLLLELIVIPISLLFVKLCTKDAYTSKIYLYGLCFSNFSFMGNAIVSSLFEEIFLEYIIFTLMLWALIYLWGVPALLVNIPSENGGILSRFKAFLNPMFICMIIGMIIGITGIKIPQFANSLISATGDCMSPIAMLITGMTIAKIDLKSVLKIKSIYGISFLRLIVYPVLFMAVCFITGIDFGRTFMICAVASLAMPMGLNTIVIPSAYGLDTKMASGMALVSHTLSVITIPIIFTVFDKLF